MRLFFRRLRLALRLPRMSYLFERAKQMDEVLLGCKLTQDTRQRLQEQRDELEKELRQLQAV